MANKTEVWLRGPLEGMPTLIMPVAHALLQAGEEITEIMAGFNDEKLWDRPTSLASAGFHLQHLSGVLNRLFTYARGKQLDSGQLEFLDREGNPYSENTTSVELVTAFNNQIDECLTQLYQLKEDILTEARTVGRGKMPSTVIGLYIHAAEHTMRHTGQLLVTVKFLNNFIF